MCSLLKNTLFESLIQRLYIGPQADNKLYVSQKGHTESILAFAEPQSTFFLIISAFDAFILALIGKFEWLVSCLLATAQKKSELLFMPHTSVSKLNMAEWHASLHHFEMPHWGVACLIVSIQIATRHCVRPQNTISNRNLALWHDSLLHFKSKPGIVA